jgi:hypothetical protein
MKILSHLFLIGLFFNLMACAPGTGDNLDSNGQPATSDSVEIPLESTLESIQFHVFSKICAECHIGATAPLGLRLDTIENTTQFLIDQPSVEDSNFNRLTSGDADNSYIIQKLEGTASTGGRMPLGRTPLPQSTIDIIRVWISTLPTN